MTEPLTAIGVPNIIRSKIHSIGPKQGKYWPTSKTLLIYCTDDGPMRLLCRVQIELRERPDQIELTRQSKQWSERLIIPRLNILMMCELNQGGLMSENV